MNALCPHWIRCFAAITLLSVLGCTQEPEPKEEKEAPPPPTAQEIVSALNNNIQPLRQAVNATQQDVPVQQGRNVVQQLRQTMNKFQGGPNFSAARDQFRRQIEDLIDQVEDDEERFGLIKSLLLAYKVIAPASNRYAKLEEFVDQMLARPQVVLKGFVETQEDLHAFLEVIDRETGERTTYKVVEGEDFHEVLRLTRIIGDRDAIELLYKPVDQEWVVKPQGQRL